MVLIHRSVPWVFEQTEWEERPQQTAFKVLFLSVTQPIVLYLGFQVRVLLRMLDRERFPTTL